MLCNFRFNTNEQFLVAIMDNIEDLVKKGQLLWVMRKFDDALQAFFEQALLLNQE